ncbi:MAG: TolC family protein [Planctomycetota bacterium]|nr:MAG: TolC family protein [Planctomycetota bacterium]
MFNRKHARVRRAIWASSGLALGCVGTLGCQSYERRPLDLSGHHGAILERGVAFEAIESFARRISSGDSTLPARFDLSDGLSPGEGEVLALFYNADLRMARLDAGIALADMRTAGLWGDPVFGFDGAEILSGGRGLEYGLTLGLTIPVSGRLEVEKDRASAALRAELLRVADAEWNVRAKVRSAWTDWAAAVARVELFREAIDQIDRVTALTDRLESAGELTRLESRLIQSQAVSVRIGKIGAERSLGEARMKLLGLMGLAPDAQIDISDRFPTVDVPVVKSDADRLLAASITLDAERAVYEVAEESLRLEVRRQYPDIEIGGGFGDEGDDRLLFGLSLPIPIFNANRAGIADARAERDRAAGAVETVFERLLRELAAARAALEASRAQREVIESSLIPMLDAQAAEVEALAGLGEVDTIILLETVTRMLEAKSLWLDHRAAEVRAAIEVARILGPDHTQGAIRVQDETSRGLGGVPFHAEVNQ